MTATPIWFGPKDRPLSGWLHVPDSGRARAGVVICPPLAHEHQETYSTLRVLATDLAGHEICALRVDYDGTGDSAGGENDPARVDAWLGSVREAIAFLRRAGVTSLLIVGVRFGALIAGLVAEEDSDIEGLVLWDPVASGRSYLAEQRVLSARSFNTPSSRQDGSVEVPGMTFDAGTVTEIRKLDLSRGARVLARQVLVLTRSDRGPGPLASRLDGPCVEWKEATGQEDLIERGMAAGVVAYQTSQTVVEWAHRVSPATSSELHIAARTSSAVVALTEDGAPIVETPAFCGQARLFGVLTEAPVPRSTTTVLFLNVATGNRTGPSRLWVDVGRQLAAAGIRSFRMDLSGLGDSPVRSEGQPWFTPRTAEHFDDVADACAWLSPDNPSDVVLIGLCSSGYQVLESALSIRPRGVIAVNPITSFRPPERRPGLRSDPRRRIVLPRRAIIKAYYASRYYKQSSALSPGGRYPNLGRRLRSLSSSRLGALQRARKLIRRARTHLTWRCQILAEPRRRPSRWLTELVADNVDVVIVCGKPDVRPVLFAVPNRLLEKLRQTGSFQFTCISDLEHVHFTSDRRHALADMLTGHVVGRFGPTPAGSTPGPASLMAAKAG